MILSTHSIVGAATAAAATSNPAIGVLIGVGSHFLLDMIPHWDYDLASKVEPEQSENEFGSMVFDRRFVVDCFKLGADFGIGIFVVVVFTLIAPRLWPVLLAGMVGGVLPDILQFGYFVAPRVFSPIQRFHKYVHSHLHILSAKEGIVMQVLIVSVAVMVFSTVFIGL